MFETSVIVATFNRCRLLERMLRSMTRLERPAGRQWELIVVDNNSSDRTRSVVNEFGGRLPVRRVVERRQGQTFARNRGLAEARGAFIVYTDDDVVVDPGWLAALCRAADAHPEAAFFGGRILPDYRRRPPAFFDAAPDSVLSGLVGCYNPGGPERPYKPGDRLPFGGNVAFQEAALRRAGGFNTDLGPRLKGRVNGGETELLQRLTAAGERGWFVPAALVHHAVTAPMMTAAHVLRYAAGAGAFAVRDGRLTGPGRALAGVPTWLIRRIIECGGRLGRARAGRDARRISGALWQLGFHIGVARELRRRSLAGKRVDRRP